MATQTTLSEQLRRAVDASGLSRYEICKRCGLPQSTLSRFMHGRPITMATADTLAAVLGLRLTGGDAPRKAKR